MKYTKENSLYDFPPIIGWVTLSNGIKIQVEYRATLYGYLQRGYYLDENDKIERAIL